MSITKLDIHIGNVILKQSYHTKDTSIIFLRVQLKEVHSRRINARTEWNTRNDVEL